MVQAIWFNEKQQAEFSLLKSKGYISQDFKDFVKSAFHEKLDRVNIEKITFNQTQYKN